jgi:hypothetical protein
VDLPFTPAQFFSVLADYNRAFWPVVVASWLATIVALTMVWRQPERWSPMLSLFLSALWLWNAVAYHALLFTRINPAAWLFSALFAVQAVLFLRAGLRRTPMYFSSSAARQGVGVALAVYSLAYPFLTIALGHEYPATPTFGLPCPTVILTIGLLLTARGGTPASLAAIPIVWGFIGGSAAVLLQVPTDYGLLAAGVLLLGVVVASWLGVAGGADRRPAG